MAKIDPTELHAMNRSHFERIQEIMKANPDLADRLRANVDSMYYDGQEDIFTVRLKDPPALISESVNNRTFFNVDPISNRVFGVEVIGVAELIHENPTFRSLFFQMLNIRVGPGGPNLDHLATHVEMLASV